MNAPRIDRVRLARPMAATSAGVLACLVALGLLAVLLALLAPRYAAAEPPVLLVFGAQWCQPCHDMADTVERIERTGLARVQHIDIDANPQLTHRWTVPAIPAYVLLVAGHESGRIIGATSYARLADLCRRGVPPRGQFQRPDAGGPPPAVVRVITWDTPARDHRGGSLGSGAIIDADGQTALVATAAHNLRGAASFAVTVAGQTVDARPLGYDPLWDWAFLEIPDAGVKPLAIAQEDPAPGDCIGVGGFGDQRGNYRGAVGEFAQWVAPGRDQPFELAQIDAVVRPGDSGGPVWNTSGEWLGVVSCGEDASRWTVACCFPRLRGPLQRIRDFWRARRAARNRGVEPAGPTAEAVEPFEDPGPPPIPIPTLTADAAIPGPLPYEPTEASSDQAVEPDVAIEATPPISARPPDVTAAESPGDVVDVPGAAADPSPPAASIAVPPACPTPPPPDAGLADSAVRLATDAAVRRLMPWALGALGLGGLTPAGYAAWLALRFVIRRRRARKTPTAPAAEAGRPFPPVATAARASDEARQLLQLSEREGRSPLHDALIGRLTSDELDNIIDADPTGPDADVARRIRRQLDDRFNQIAPLAVYPQASPN